MSFEELRRERPDAVILMIGTNDAKEKSLVPEAFRIRYSVLLDRILAESHVKLVVATIPPARFGRRAKLIAGINGIIKSEVEKRAAAGKSIRLVDVYALLDDRADFVDNAAHERRRLREGGRRLRRRAARAARAARRGRAPGERRALGLKTGTEFWLTPRGAAWARTS